MGKWRNLLKNVFEERIPYELPISSTENAFHESQHHKIVHATPEEFLDYWLRKAIDTRASDIHFECFRKSLVVRYRIDGVLKKITDVPSNLQSGLVTCIKLLARLRLDERRVPQDGRFAFEHHDQAFDFRVSIIPSFFGESVVLRILEHDNKTIDLRSLGASEEQTIEMNMLTSASNGMLLVAGPTGSGKSTTLYSIIKNISSPERKVLTVEDPVEYQISGVNQVAVNETVGMTFARALRAMLRQAPNIIFVGEIRDKETAEMAIRAALTGHLVLSTVHARDTLNAVTRLIDLGVPAYLIAATLRGILSQRLVQKLCQKCAKKVPCDEEFLRRSGYVGDVPADAVTYEAVGCDRCMLTGYRGRLAAYEVLSIDAEWRELIHDYSDEDILREKFTREGRKTMRESAVRHYLEGNSDLIQVRDVIAEVGSYAMAH
ncbi:MAG: GspE/PulE family protein [Puniceicoccales bacterium]|jgi:type II secretory ATPase GspE/PulE/Tfp pilus assembly ATPase PilB-like protein|nr:GspE/PulE family protein [Puniceicoccales bacterium]